MSILCKSIGSLYVPHSINSGIHELCIGIVSIDGKLCDYQIDALIIISKLIH